MITVLSSGLYTTIQDTGRFGHQHLGVPLSGVMDSYAARLANDILGNPADAAVLEFTLQCPKLQFDQPAHICITGADCSATLNDLDLLLYQVTAVKSGDILSFGRMQNGIRVYLAVSGGFQTEKVLGSRSMYSGVTTKAQIKKGDVIPYTANANPIPKTFATIKIKERYTHHIEAFEGPEFHHLNAIQYDKLFGQTFTISNTNNRMAYQLEEMLPNDLEAIITSLVLPGTVQLTPSGKIIVLMRDCQTTGGYPRILQLPEKSINSMAQLRTGDAFKFSIRSYRDK